jgi:hypothetical protein
MILIASMDNRLYAVAFFMAVGLKNDISIVSGLLSYFFESEFTANLMMDLKTVEVEFWPEFLCDDEERYHNIRERLDIIQQTWCRRMREV